MVVGPVDRRGKHAGNSENTRAERGASSVYSRGCTGESGCVCKPEEQRRCEEVSGAHLWALAGLQNVQHGPSGALDIALRLNRELRAEKTNVRGREHLGIDLERAALRIETDVHDHRMCPAGSESALAVSLHDCLFAAETLYYLD